MPCASAGAAVFFSFVSIVQQQLNVIFEGVRIKWMLVVYAIIVCD